MSQESQLLLVAIQFPVGTPGLILHEQSTNVKLAVHPLINLCKVNVQGDWTVFHKVFALLQYSKFKTKLN